MKLLIACDGATDLRALEGDLRRAGLPASGQAIVLSVADLVPVPAGPPPAVLPAAVRRAREQTARALKEATQVAERAAAQLRAALAGWSIGAEAQVDAPAWAIVKKSGEWNPDLIVLCSDNRSQLNRIVLGSVSRTVLTHALRSVRIVRPPRRPPDAPQRILIGSDGSPGADAAVAAVAARSWRSGAEARVVTVFDATLANMLGFSDDTNDERDAAERFLQRAAAALGAAGLTATTALIEGDPKHALVEQADSWDADALFVGARGLRAVERILLGSVSDSVAARAHCTVEVVRK
jgi:nucleotide-binding universal stress UspA family protein